MAETGHAGTQSPQPVHARGSISGAATPPAATVNRMARGAQSSPQLRQTTRLRAKQADEITAVRGRAGSAGVAGPRNRPVRNCLRLMLLAILVPRKQPCCCWGFSKAPALFDVRRAVGSLIHVKPRPLPAEV
jgi:hypothetical protein